MIEFPKNAQIICFSGDWHQNTSYAMRATYWARKQDADVIVHVGDFLGWSINHINGYLNALEEQAVRDSLIIMFVDGNHEDFDWLLAQPVSEDGVRRLREHIWHLPRGFRWEWSGVSFLALGGAHSVNKDDLTPGVEWWPQEWITIPEAYKAVEGGHADVMITHDAPYGANVPLPPDNIWSEVELRSAEIHRKLLRNIVDEVTPHFLFHGHYHVNYVDRVNNTMVYGLNKDKSEFHQNMSIWRIGNLKGRLDTKE